MFSKIFPLIDHLYIYQLLEYDAGDFISWFIKNPLKRNLQRKQRLDFTFKIQLLAVITSFIMLTLATFFSVLIFEGSVWGLLILYILFESISPFFILIASLIILPLQVYQKGKVITQAKRKMKRLSELQVVAIVGSYAKTSTKNMLYTLLWKDFRVVKTPKSFNTELSIARTINRDLKENTQVFIAEMDAYHKGDIQDLAKIAKPKFGIITSIAEQHLGRFKKMENLARTQFEIAEALDKDGVLFLNPGNEWINRLQEEHNVRKVFYGEGEEQYHISGVRQDQSGVHFKMHFNKEVVEILLPVYGVHNALNFLAASAIAYKLGLPLKKIQERAKLILPTEHRLEVKKMGKYTLIDNSYNTNPEAAKSSFQLLKDLPGSQKIILTPGLVELGNQAYVKNKEFAINASFADAIIIVGENSKKALMDGLNEANYPKEKIHLVKSTEKGLNLVAKIADEGCVVLLENDLPDQYF